MPDGDPTGWAALAVGAFTGGVGFTAHRLALASVHATAVFCLWLAARLAWPGLSRGFVRASLVVSLALSLLPLARTWADPPRPERGDRASDRLWGLALPSPDVVVRRIVPVPAPGPSGRLRLRVNLAAEYRGEAWLEATVNGTAVGRLLKEGEAEGRSTVDGCREAYFDGTILGDARMATIDLSQPMPDPELRIATFATPRGAVARGEAAWIGTASGLVRGVVHPADGRVRGGAPVAWLEAG